MVMRRFQGLGPTLLPIGPFDLVPGVGRTILSREMSTSDMSSEITLPFSELTPANFTLVLVLVCEAKPDIGSRSEMSTSTCVMKNGAFFRGGRPTSSSKGSMPITLTTNASCSFLLLMMALRESGEGGLQSDWSMAAGGGGSGNTQ